MRQAVVVDSHRTRGTRLRSADLLLRVLRGQRNHYRACLTGCLAASLSAAYPQSRKREFQRLSKDLLRTNSQAGPKNSQAGPKNLVRQSLESGTVPTVLRRCSIVSACRSIASTFDKAKKQTLAVSNSTLPTTVVQGGRRPCFAAITAAISSANLKHIRNGC